MEIQFNCLYIFFGIYFLPRQLPRLPQRKLRPWHIFVFARLIFFRNFSHIDFCHSCVRHVFWCHSCVRYPLCEHFFLCQTFWYNCCVQENTVVISMSVSLNDISFCQVCKNNLNYCFSKCWGYWETVNYFHTLFIVDI